MRIKEVKITSLSFEEFKEKSLSNKEFKEIYMYGEIEIATVNSILKISSNFLDLSGYKRYIRSDEIRHINKRHPEDSFFLANIDIYFPKFKNIKYHITEDDKTDRPNISIVSRIGTEEGILRCVENKHRNIKRKELFIKTIFIER